MLVIENILLLFEATKYEVTLNILHTLIIAVVVYIASRNKKVLRVDFISNFNTIFTIIKIHIYNHTFLY